MTRSRPFALGVLLAAVLGLAGSIAFAASRSDDPSWSMMRYGPGMMGYGTGGGGERVDDIGEARRQAQRFADRLDLRVGEVMQFSNHYYAELSDDDGRGATEVLVNPATGAVWLEYGPAMMWNTRYGMHRGDEGARVSSDQARRLAQRRLTARRTGLTAGEAEPFPGYYTLHTLRGERVTGMLSVNAATGVIWEHSWHGAFVTMSG